MSLLITGSCGFIGSRLAVILLKNGREDLLLSDAAGHRSRECFQGLEAQPFIDRLELLDVLDEKPSMSGGPWRGVAGVFHLGACTDTGQTDETHMEKWNTGYSRALWNGCVKRGIPLVYASSAATYGKGEAGYSDDHRNLANLKPLNLYGRSKHAFDLWAIAQRQTPPGWWGLKFFNVYGPGEGHKGSMASSVFHGYHEVKKTGRMMLFKSHRDDIPDGQQKRDFIFVDDIVKMCLFFLDNRPANGIYNCGTGGARSFLDLAQALFKALGRGPEIQWVPTPEKYRAGYQYFTQADMGKTRNAGFAEPFTTLENGVKQYVDWLRERS